MQAMNQPVSRDLFAAQALSNDERESLRRLYQENGYVVLKNVVPRDKLSQLRAHILDEFDSAKRSGVLFSGGGSMSGHLNCFPGAESRFVYELFQERGILDLIKEIFPRPLGGLHVGCNLNLPGSVPQHYHVDSAYLQEFLVVNTAIVDTDLVNGAIDVVPGTHNKFYKYWRFAVERPYRFHVRIPMQQGDVLVRTSNLWHRGMPNNATLPRPMLAFTFGDPGVKPLPDAFQADGGKTTFHANWFRTTRLGRLRERTFIAAPITYAGYRFVRSLFGDKGYATQ
jgi:ectoine hydroxylase-related dioxygenase (phytanoyl-CoA dioxygenase family)